MRRACLALESALGGEIFVPCMKAASLEMLSKIMIRRLGQADVKIENIGVRPGEKTHEQLISRDECKRTRAMQDLWVILPYFASAELLNPYRDCPSVGFSEYASDCSPQFSEAELESLLESEDFLTPVGRHPTVPLYFKKSSFEFH